MKKIIKNNVTLSISNDRNSEKAAKTMQVQKKKMNSSQTDKWICQDSPLWRNYLNSYIEREKALVHDDKFDDGEPVTLKLFSDLESTEEIHPPYHRLPLNTFNSSLTPPPNCFSRKEKIRIWRHMKMNTEINMSSYRDEMIEDVKQPDRRKWADFWPCIHHNIAGEMRQMEIMKQLKVKGSLACQSVPAHNSHSELSYDDFANQKELGHARIPKLCASLNKLLVVDRSCGERPGLVDGDYVTIELTSENENKKHVYAEVCLRGTKGMDLIELNSMRVRKKTWKFCFYQALVALLAKTQLRYKYASTVNIDYIYDHAWMLFIHVGSLNIKDNHRLDDVVVYNYKYNVELELIHELTNVPVITKVNAKYLEKNVKTIDLFKRPELMKTTEELGWVKIKQLDELAVHEESEKIEKWFDELPDNYHNCIFRTTRFSIAFWNDGNFWYLYNPYCCDEYGFWDNEGYACVMKFCTRTTLRRHLMILFLRAYVHKLSSPFENGRSNKQFSKNSEDKNDVVTIQIFQMIYHCVKIHNIKLIQRTSPNQRVYRIRKELDNSNYYPFTFKNKSIYECKETMNVTLSEQLSWLKNLKVTWTQSPIVKKKQNEKDEIEMMEKFRWHEYYVEKVGKLFSLWSEVHPTGEIFTRQNRGKQMHACYIVCAGMMRIMAPEYWNAKILDAIVMCGDRYYTLSRLQSETTALKNVMENARVCNEYLIRHFNIGEMLFEIDVLAPIYGALYTKDSLWKNLDQMFLNNSFGILSCANACLGVFKFYSAYYIFDVNSIGPPIFIYGDSVAYLMRATSFHELMVTLVLAIGSNECSSFVLNPIDIVKIIDVGSSQGKLGMMGKKIGNPIDFYERGHRKK